MSQQELRYVFSDADVAGYNPGADWLRFVVGLPAAGRSRERATAIELLAPALPVPP